MEIESDMRFGHPNQWINYYKPTICPSFLHRVASSVYLDVSIDSLITQLIYAIWLWSICICENSKLCYQRSKICCHQNSAKQCVLTLKRFPKKHFTMIFAVTESLPDSLTPQTATIEEDRFYLPTCLIFLKKHSCYI